MADDLSGILETTEPTLLATGFVLTEGPVWHPGGYLTFVDLRSSQLLRWDTDGSVTLAREDTGEGNGCTLDRQGRFLMCQGADQRSITRMDADGSITTVADRWLGKRLNRPNDVVCRSDGSIFFTDPETRLPPELREVGFPAVFRIDPEGHVHLAADVCAYPNGLAFSPDESTLYVSDSRRDEGCRQEEERGEYCAHRRVHAFNVATDGTLTDHRIFVDMSSAERGVPDGMKVDVEGRVFCTGSGGIWVMDPEGNRLGIIRLPEAPSRNLAFGGPDFRTMYVTAGNSVYSLGVRTPGIAVF